jgi:ubiquitin carboxyl-terminal hydrolase 34
VETVQSREETEAAAAADTIMKIDTPDPITPSTPPQPEPLTNPPRTEPRSSRVTLNLRKAGCLEATPTTPTPPTRSRSRSDDIKVSVEESEVDVERAHATDDEMSPSAASDMDSSDAPVVAVHDDEDDDLGLVDTRASTSPLEREPSPDMTAIMFSFPYHAAEETCYDTLVRLVQYFQQRECDNFFNGSRTLSEPEPVQFDEVLVALSHWFDKYLQCSGPGMYQAVFESYLEHRHLWQSMHELFWAVYQRRYGRDCISNHL